MLLAAVVADKTGGGGGSGRGGDKESEGAGEGTRGGNTDGNETTNPDSCWSSRGAISVLCDEGEAALGRVGADTVGGGGGVAEALLTPPAVGDSLLDLEVSVLSGRGGGTGADAVRVGGLAGGVRRRWSEALGGRGSDDVDEEEAAAAAAVG